MEVSWHSIIEDIGCSLFNVGWYCVSVRYAGLYDIPRTRTLIGSKAFSVAGPTAWNSLPQSIRNIKSAFTFKRHLKTHLFKCATTDQSTFSVFIFYRFIFIISFFNHVLCKAPLADLYCKRRPISFYLYCIVLYRSHSREWYIELSIISIEFYDSRMNQIWLCWEE